MLGVKFAVVAPYNADPCVRNGRNVREDATTQLGYWMLFRVAATFPFPISRFILYLSISQSENKKKLL